MSKKLPHQRSCQDICMDPHYQKPQQYADLHHHRPSPQTPIEINEIGPTIQQGVIHLETRDKLPKQEGDLDQNDYVLNCIHENRPLKLNDVGRPVFVNHYYAGEAFIPVTSKKLIKLDECDVLIENSLRNAELQGIEREYREHS